MRITMIFLPHKNPLRVTILELSGRLDVFTAPTLERLIVSLRKIAPVLIIDLTQVYFLDLAGVRVLIRGLEFTGGRCFLCGLSYPTQIILQITRKERLFPIFPSQNEAIALNC